MLRIAREQFGDKLNLTLTGRLDRNTSEELETKLKPALDGVKELGFDFSNLDYISSAGLRVLLAAQKKMKGDGKIRIKGAKKEIRDIFDMTGFSNILSVEWL